MQTYGNCVGSSAGKEICQVYGPADVLLMGVQYTSRLLNLHKIIDDRGVLYFPIPIAKRLLYGMTKNLAQGAKTSVTVLQFYHQMISIRAIMLTLL